MSMKSVVIVSLLHLCLATVDDVQTYDSPLINMERRSVENYGSLSAMGNIQIIGNSTSEPLGSPLTIGNTLLFVFDTYMLVNSTEYMQSANGVSYAVQMATATNANNFSMIYPSDSATFSMAVAGLTSGANYFVRLAAVGAAGAAFTSAVEVETLPSLPVTSVQMLAIINGGGNDPGTNNLADGANNNGASTGAIVGAVIGGVALLAIVAFVTAFIILRRNRRKNSARRGSSAGLPPTQGDVNPNFSEPLPLADSLRGAPGFAGIDVTSEDGGGTLRSSTNRIYRSSVVLPDLHNDPNFHNNELATVPNSPASPMMSPMMSPIASPVMSPISADASSPVVVVMPTQADTNAAVETENRAYLDAAALAAASGVPVTADDDINDVLRRDALLATTSTLGRDGRESLRSSASSGMFVLDDNEVTTGETRDDSGESTVPPSPDRPVPVATPTIAPAPGLSSSTVVAIEKNNADAGKPFMLTDKSAMLLMEQVNALRAFSREKEKTRRQIADDAEDGDDDEEMVGEAVDSHGNTASSLSSSNRFRAEVTRSSQSGVSAVSGGSGSGSGNDTAPTGLSSSSLSSTSSPDSARAFMPSPNNPKRRASMFNSGSQNVNRAASGMFIRRSSVVLMQLSGEGTTLGDVSDSPEEMRAAPATLEMRASSELQRPLSPNKSATMPRNFAQKSHKLRRKGTSASSGSSKTMEGSASAETRERGKYKPGQFDDTWIGQIVRNTAMQRSYSISHKTEEKSPSRSPGRSPNTSEPNTPRSMASVDSTHLHV